MSYKTLLNGSFKGIPFFVEDDEGLQSFGRKLAVKEIPNTSEQFAEDTGGFSPVFKVNIFWRGKNAQADYRKFRNAANEKGFGKLVLPLHGEFQVKAGECKPQFTPNKDPDYICVECEFFTSRTEAGFVEAKATLPAALAAGERARTSILDKLVNYSTKAVDFLGSVTQKLDLESMLKQIGELAGFAPSSDLGAILSKIDIIAGNADIILNSGSLLGEQLMGKNGIYSLVSTSLIGNGSLNLINTIARLSNNHESTLQTQITQINAGELAYSTKPYWDETTQTRIDRNKGRATLSEIHRVNLLIIAYEQYASTVYDTEEQADDAKRSIEEAYLALVHGQVGINDGLPIVESTQTPQRFIDEKEVIEPFENARITALQAAETSLVVRFKVEKYTLESPISIYNLAYLSQAEQITNEQDLLDLAKTVRNANGRKTYGITGTVKVLRRVDNV